MKQKITKALLAIGGSEVDYVKDDIDKKLLEDGKSYSEIIDVYEDLQPNRCHTNSCLVWLTNECGMEICTGYALSHTRWVQHTWLVLGPSIIETCGPKCDNYYGITLAPLAAIKFCQQQLPGCLENYEAAFDTYLTEWAMRKSVSNLLIKGQKG